MALRAPQWSGWLPRDRPVIKGTPLRLNPGSAGYLSLRLSRVICWSVTAALLLPCALLAEMSPATEHIRTALEEGRYVDAERAARDLLDHMDVSHGPDSRQSLEILELLAVALIKGGKGNESETLELAQRGVSLAERRDGPDQLQVANHLMNLGRVLWQRNEIAAAQQTLERVLQIREGALEPNHPDIAAALQRLGSLYGAREEYVEARRLLERAVEIQRESRGEDHPEYGRALGELAVVLTNMGDLEEAKVLNERQIQVYEEVFGPRHLKVGFALITLGYILRGMEDYAAAIAILERALEIQQENLGDDHPVVAGTLTLLGQAEGRRGNWLKARSAHERSLTIREKALGPDHPDLAASLGSLADILIDLGDHAESLILQKRARAIYVKNFGPDHPSVGQAEINIGIAMKGEGDYAAARSHYERGLSILEKAFGPDHPNIVHGLTFLADLLSQLGDVGSAAHLYERALRISESKLGPEHTNVAHVLQEFGEMYRSQYMFADALVLYERAVKVFDKVYGPGSSITAICLAKIADAQWNLGRFDESARSTGRSLEIFDRTLGREHPEAILALGNLARLQHRSGNLENARTLRRRMHRGLELSLGPEHPWVAWSKNELARLDWESGDVEATLNGALRAEQLLRQHFIRTARSLAEREALSYERARNSGLHLAISVLAQVSSAELPPASAERLWHELIRSRGMVLDEMASRQHTSHLGDDPEVAGLIRDLRAARGRFASLIVGGTGAESPQDHLRLVSEAQADKERLERMLAATSREFRESLFRQAIGIRDVRAALPHESSLVAYVKYDRYPLHGPEHEEPCASTHQIPSYLALVLSSRDSHPEVIPLGAAEVVDDSIMRWQDAISGEPTGLPLAGSRSEDSYRLLGSRLRETIWDPVARSVAESKTVFIVPDGAINMVSFATLPNLERGYLVEGGLRVHYLSTERDLIRGESTRTGDNRLLALGGADFDASPDEIARSTAGGGSSSDAAQRGGHRLFHAYRSPAPGCEDFATLHFDPLPGSAAEAEEIETLWSGRTADDDAGGADVLLLTGPGANEAAFKRWAPDHRVIHVATHGFFLDDRCDSNLGKVLARARTATGRVEPASLLIGDNPLLLSGLALAGANGRRESGGDLNREDGILTAEEIASLDLSGVEWAVLSACETGVGDIRPGEGVLGLRRAFETAGAGTLIMSLWKVQDDASRQWMRALYEGRRGGLSTVEAVRAAGLTLLETRRSEGKSTHPFYWGAFIAAGDWR
jgi:CHAT domain-containing protein/tetratricopeptide (TPR) repeat protein